MFLAFAATGMTAGAQTTNSADATTLAQQIATLQSAVARLSAQLASLQQSNDSLTREVATLKLNHPLKQGDQGDDVKTLQQMLATDPSIFPEGSVTGFFGPKTKDAIKKLQEKMGLESVGNVGPKTLDRINQILAEGAGQSGKIPPGLLKEHGHVISAKLNAQSDSGVNGFVMLTEQNGRIKLDIALLEKNTATTSTARPAHIHLGSCAATGPIKWPLGSVVGGKSTTVLDITMKDIASSTPLYVNVHKSDAEIGTSLSCGDLHVPMNVWAKHDGETDQQKNGQGGRNEGDRGVRRMMSPGTTTNMMSPQPLRGEGAGRETTHYVY
jgi:peptidoglycan hydrolase-like protein with peptidoglycan-binding domain